MKKKINVSKKGSSGEREFCEWIQNILSLDQKPKRILEQTREGGADVIVDNYMFEVKRVEKLNLRPWWLQVCKANRDKNDKYLPVVVFRQNNKDWSVLISATYIGLKSGFIIVKDWEAKRWLKINHKKEV